MKFKNIALATAAASLLVVAPNAAAQERGTENAPKAERGQEADTKRRGAQDARPAASETKQDASRERAAAMAAAKKEEKRHRENLAKISRLREIFTKRGATAQLAKLENAEKREGARYAKVKEAAAERMSVDLAGEVREMRDKGKTRGQVKRM